MLGALRKVAIGGAAVGVVAAGLTAGAPAQAVLDNEACVIVEVPANVYNLYNFTGSGHGSTQPSKGAWTNPMTGQVGQHYGLFYPSHDPVAGHNTPRTESFGSHPGSPIPATPIQTGDNFYWTQAGRCTNSNLPFSASGTGWGYCGRSVGVGIGSVGGQQSIIRWESAASQLVLLDPSAFGSVNARPNLPNDPAGSCTNGSAVLFKVDGSIFDLRG